ncbi:hypothetical protein ALC53_11453 [Atta colombica]|uniref:Nuclease HARBI1 n=1 Tax=Atta colombica TaxID=520822 RepID=A0A151I087_9HYME|nr:hypothetical protein ALC53_11453 [Atta colombica]
MSFPVDQYLTNDSFRCVDRFNVSKSTAWRIVQKIVNSLYAHVTKFIQWPMEEAEQITKKINKNYGSISTIDRTYIKIAGTHIKIAPKDYNDSYVNRKGFHSIQLQINLKFIRILKACVTMKIFHMIVIQWAMHTILSNNGITKKNFDCQGEPEEERRKTKVKEKTSKRIGNVSKRKRKRKYKRGKIRKNGKKIGIGVRGERINNKRKGEKERSMLFWNCIGIWNKDIDFWRYVKILTVSAYMKYV